MRVDADPAATASLSKSLLPPILRRVGTKEPLSYSPPSYSVPLPSPRRVGTKERFTLTEMFSLVEGIEAHGLKWAKVCS